MTQHQPEVGVTFDAVIVGAGFAGLYMLHQLRARGLTCRVFEAGHGVGGTWYWNRYPGARCDAESLAYSYSFDTELEQEWEWSERYSSQPEILRYIEHVADRFDLLREIRFGCRVESARFDEGSGQWRVGTDQGDEVSARFCIMASGCLSVPLIPDIPGLEDFSRSLYMTGRWPHDGVDFRGQRVGIIGTGSSAVQSIPIIAKEAAHLSVFQRTPNFSMPARNQPLDGDFVRAYKRNYRAHRDYYHRGLASGFGETEIEPCEASPAVESAVGVSDEEFVRICEDYWLSGGLQFVFVAGDVIQNEASNERVAKFVRQKIREIVDDPETAESLCPRNHPIGTKRPCIDTDYFATYNRDNVELVDLSKTPIERISETGIQTTERFVEVDSLILATGFDAMTGALSRIDIRGVDGLVLSEKWTAGPRTYLGLMVAGFPNLFTITGPGSPSVLSNMVISIEQHVDFIANLIDHMKSTECSRVEAELESEDAWVDHVQKTANETLYPRAGSWYMGANVPGKPRIFMPYVAGVGAYRDVCEDVVANDYRGFSFSS